MVDQTCINNLRSIPMTAAAAMMSGNLTLTNEQNDIRISQLELSPTMRNEILSAEPISPKFINFG